MINPILLHALDILSAVLTVISLYYVKKYNWMWIVYLLASMIFFALMLYNGVWGWAFAALCFCYIACRNYTHV